jgi:hypothetical protein
MLIPTTPIARSSLGVRIQRCHQRFAETEDWETEDWETEDWETEDWETEDWETEDGRLEAGGETALEWLSPSLESSSLASCVFMPL